MKQVKMSLEGDVMGRAVEIRQAPRHDYVKAYLIHNGVHRHTVTVFRAPLRDRMPDSRRHVGQILDWLDGTGVWPPDTLDVLMDLLDTFCRKLY